MIWSNMKKTADLIDLLREIYNIWITERPSQMAAALAYYGVFSLAPAIFIAFTIAGFFVNQAALMDRLFGRLAIIVGPELSEHLQASVIKLMETTSSGSTLTSLVSSLALLFAAAGLFYQLQFVLNSIWKTPPPSNKISFFFRQQLFAFAAVIGLGLLLVLVAVAGLFFTWLSSLIPLAGFSSAYAILGFTLVAAITFGIIYKILPNTKIAWSDVWFGALIAAVLMTLGGLAFGFYLSSARLNTALDAAGTLAVLLVGIYYLAQIFLLGALFTRVYATLFGSKQGTTT
jgi:membrane protein